MQLIKHPLVYPPGGSKGDLHPILITVGHRLPEDLLQLTAGQLQLLGVFPGGIARGNQAGAGDIDDPLVMKVFQSPDIILTW